jgi:hypothetical protein
MKYRIIYILISTLLIILTVSLLPVMGGKPLFDWHSLQMTIPSQREATHTPVFTSVGPSEPTTVFRWKGDDNIWHFGQTPPTSGTNYETIIIDAEHSHASLSDTIPSNAETTQTDIPSSLSLYNPAEIERILQEARSAQKLMQEHQERLNSELSNTEPQ